MSRGIDDEMEDKIFLSLLEISKMKAGANNVIRVDSEVFKDKNILVVPEGSSNFFPYELLICQEESDTTKYYFLGEYANITYAPSLSSYVQITKDKQDSNQSKKAILASANPNTDEIESYIENVFALSFVENDVDIRSYGNIENVDNEIDEINNLFIDNGYRNESNITSLNSKKISETNFKNSNIEDAKYIHIAAHGIEDPENPKYSGILLGKNQQDKNDGLLQAHEIFPLNLNADLVTLSACFSAAGEIDSNEGNIGIYRSFLIAGSKSVIVSLWKVEDKATSMLFIKFYEYLLSGYSKSKALQLAKMYIKNETVYSHPVFWAPFILMGES